MVTVTVPRLLADIIGGVRRVPVEAEDVGGALLAACEHHPALRVHLFDESGALRRHVTCLHNGDVVRDTLTRPLRAGDEVIVLQAVSGG